MSPSPRTRDQAGQVSVRTGGPPGTDVAQMTRLAFFYGPPVRVGLAVAAPASYGLIAGWWTPRGPVTTSQALAAMVLGLAVGVAAGWVMRSRWAMLLSLLVFVAVFQVMRLGAVGPTVDGVHPGSFYGLVAMIAGRGFLGLLTLRR